MKKSTTITNGEHSGAGTPPLVATTEPAAYVALQGEVQELHAMISEYLDGGLQNDDLERIKVPGAGGLQWELPNGSSGPHMVNTFDGIIVGVQTTRAYWPDSFSGGNTPPQCASRDGVTGIGDPGGTCEVCPLNKWGSGKNGIGTACGERKLVYILRPEDALPVVLSLPITSIKPLRRYQFRLLNKHTPPSTVITRFGLERTKSTSGILYSLVTFTAMGPLPPAVAPLAQAYAKTIKTALGLQPEASPPRARPEYDDSREIPESDPPFGSFAKEKPDDIPY